MNLSDQKRSRCAQPIAYCPLLDKQTIVKKKKETFYFPKSLATNSQGETVGSVQAGFD